MRSFRSDAPSRACNALGKILEIGAVGFAPADVAARVRAAVRVRAVENYGVLRQPGFRRDKPAGAIHQLPGQPD